MVTVLDGAACGAEVDREGVDEEADGRDGTDGMDGMGRLIWGMEAETTWVICSSFCLTVTLKSFISTVTSPIFDLLTILINS
jgi:hypothetical protein